MYQTTAFRVAINVLMVLIGGAVIYGISVTRSSALSDLFSPLSLVGSLAIVVGVLRMLSFRGRAELSVTRVFLGLGVLLAISTLFIARTTSSEIAGFTFASYIVGLAAFAWTLGTIKRLIRKHRKDYPLKILQERLSRGAVSVAKYRELLAELEPS